MADTWEIDTLRLGFDHLIDTISVDSVLSKARATGLILVRDYDTCKAEPTEYKQAEKFLRFLEKAVIADPRKFDTFLSILDQVGQKSIAEYLRTLIPRSGPQQQQEAAAVAMSSSQPIGRLGEAVQLGDLSCFKYKDASGKTKRVFVIEDMANRWKDLGSALKFSSAEIQNIDTANHKPEDCCRDLMTKWLSGFVSQRDERPRTWATLLEAMEDSRLGDLAEKLEPLLKQ